MPRPAFITAQQEEAFCVGFRRASQTGHRADFNTARLMSSFLTQFEEHADQPVSAFKSRIGELFTLRAPSQQKYVRMARAYRRFLARYGGRDAGRVWVAFGGWNTVTIFDGLTQSDGIRLEEALYSEIYETSGYVTTDGARAMMDRLGIKSTRAYNRGHRLFDGELALLDALLRRLKVAYLKRPSRRNTRDRELLAMDAADHIQTIIAQRS